ncbi:MAG: tRNA (adenosine(37)-N6)-threonylcarbamoyltransferase complex dimerization subunit type 1 TsaB [Candidatus Omnitrophica bacterium]|nr:tRNA (adenosine(37)-N6)-threonylcarbamoyltransferase complex dimerization subunit type 1 TsaB [Candidatus Omnitrophota bacterium]
MNLLGIDTSSENVSLSIMRRGKIIVDINRRMRFGASNIVSFIEKSLKKHSLRLKQIDAFVLGKGPGSFTGLRVSYSVMKALSITLNKPIITIGSFYAIAYPFMSRYKKIAVITDARKGLVYSACFVDGKMKGKEKLTTFEEALKGKDGYFFLTYDQKICDQNDKLLFKQGVYPRAAYLLHLAQNYGKVTPLEKLDPLYLHPKDCQVRKKS